MIANDMIANFFAWERGPEGQTVPRRAWERGQVRDRGGGPLSLCVCIYMPQSPHKWLQICPHTKPFEGKLAETCWSISARCSMNHVQAGMGCRLGCRSGRFTLRQVLLIITIFTCIGLYASTAPR